MNRIFLLALLGLVMQRLPTNAAPEGKAAKILVTLLSGAAAAEAASQTVGAKLDYNTARDVLRTRGYDVDDTAIYALRFSLNNDVSSMWWADIFNKPDIFAVVSIEGQGEFLIPEIYNEYSGQPILLRVVARHARPRQRIIITFYDDDTMGDAVWNTILQTRVTCNVGATFQAFKGLRIDTHAQGKLQLLDHPVVIDAPDFIATAEFRVPELSYSKWAATGPIVDSSHRTIGEFSFAPAWNPYEAPKEAMRWSTQQVTFWDVLTCVFLGVFGKLLCSKFGETKNVT
jgi:hypothetical protein